MKTHEILNRYFERKKAKYGFSMRAMAQQLGISASFLSRVLTGKKPVPYPLLLRLQPILEIDPEVFETIASAHEGYIGRDAFAKRGHVDLQTPLEDWSLTSPNSNSILRQWFYLAILEFTTLKKYDGTAATIARHLKLPPRTVEGAVREMASLGLLREVGGKWVKSKKKIRWVAAKSLPEIRRFHHLMMGKAQENLQLTSEKEFERRLISGITLTTSPRKAKKLKKILNEFLYEMASEAMDENATEVYHFAIQFFPLTTD